jgi:hypothetical protein
MPRFEVNTDELAAGRGHQDMVAAALGGAAGLLRAAGSSISDAAGHSGGRAAMPSQLDLVTPGSSFTPGERLIGGFGAAGGVALGGPSIAP